MLVWGLIAFYACPCLQHINSTMTSQWHITDVQAAQLLPILQMIPSATFQHDVWPHAACNVHHVHCGHHAARLPWPMHSPDLSPIENVWISSLDNWLTWPHHLSPPMNYGCILKHSGTTFCRWPSRISFRQCPTLYGLWSLLMVGSKYIDFLVFSTSITVIIYVLLSHKFHCNTLRLSWCCNFNSQQWIYIVRDEIEEPFENIQAKCPSPSPPLQYGEKL